MKVEITPNSIREAFVVWSNSDLTEGKGYEYPVYICLKEATARRLSKKGYVQGADCPITKSTVFSIGSQAYGPIRLIHSTLEDDRKQKEIDKTEAAIQKAKAAGLTEEDINNIAAKE